MLSDGVSLILNAVEAIGPKKVAVAMAVVVVAAYGVKKIQESAKLLFPSEKKEPTNMSERNFRSDGPSQAGGFQSLSTAVKTLTQTPTQL